jgi:spheroidene monooxygenase
MLCVFADPASAAAFLASAFVQDFRARTSEFLTATLRAYSCRGSWGGRRLAIAAGVPADGPVVALTRASIRPGRALEFWRKAPAAEASLTRASGCRLAVGLGEAPVLRQATFSLWDSVAAMDAYARTGAHLEAIRASHQGGYFSESMFVRFVPLEFRGTWQGTTHG